MASRLDLVALSLLWTERANCRSRRRTAGPAPDIPETDPPNPRALADLDEVLALLGTTDVTSVAASLRRRARAALADAEAKGIGLVARGETAYPARLERIADPPPVLWTRGLPASADPAVAIVGSRTATPHGLEVAFRLGLDLARAGFVVVSGLARGVDAAAHRGALRGDGRTVAVLGSGVDVMYPPEHMALAADIAASGAVVSELVPGTPPHGWHFPRRNRIISGITLGVVIVEASRRSGSLITAGCAAEQGRSVMAVPGAVLSGRNRGAHELLRDGAGVVEDARDVIAQLEADWQAVFHPDRPPEPAPTGGGSDTSRAGGGSDLPPGPDREDAMTAELVLKAMRPGEVYGLEDLVERTHAGAAELMARLARLELGGWVERVEGGRFVKAGANVLR